MYGGIGSGAIGFTSDIDCIFLYDGEAREEYDKLKIILKNEFERICGLEVDESFLSYHINYFYLGNYDGESIISFDDFFGYINYIDDLRNQTENRLFEPQFFHYPWAFSIRFIGEHNALEKFENRIQQLPSKKNRTYTSIKSYILGEKGSEIKKDYISYLKGKFFPAELEFFNNEDLRRIYLKRSFADFMEAIAPYESVKYIFRRGIFPLLHILQRHRQRTDIGLLGNEYKYILPAIDFMLKAFNVRKTLFIMGRWDLTYFLYIMDFKSEEKFCERYLKYQNEIINFVHKLIQ